MAMSAGTRNDASPSSRSATSSANTRSTRCPLPSASSAPCSLTSAAMHIARYAARSTRAPSAARCTTPSRRDTHASAVLRMMAVLCVWWWTTAHRHATSSWSTVDPGASVQRLTSGTSILSSDSPSARAVRGKWPRHVRNTRSSSSSSAVSSGAAPPAMYGSSCLARATVSTVGCTDTSVCTVRTRLSSAGGSSASPENRLLISVSTSAPRRMSSTPPLSASRTSRRSSASGDGRSLVRDATPTSTAATSASGGCGASTGASMRTPPGNHSCSRIWRASVCSPASMS